MTELELALRELERLQGIIDRHEGHVFTLRGWLVTVLGALVAAYYAENIEFSHTVFRVALLVVGVLFIVMELRHVNVIEAVVNRAMALEKLIADQRPTNFVNTGWYDGPRVSAACAEGAGRLRPETGMTLRLYWPVYLVVVAIIVSAMAFLPVRQPAASQQQRATSFQAQPNK